MAKTAFDREELRVKLLQLSGVERGEDWTEETSVSIINETLSLIETIANERNEAIDLYIKDFTQITPENSTREREQEETKITKADYINEEYL